MDQATFFIIIIAGICLFFGGIAYYLITQLRKMQTPKDTKETEMLTKWLESFQGDLNSRLKDVQGTMDERLKHVQNQLFTTTDTLNKRAEESSNTLNERLDKAAQVIGDVQKELGSMSEIGRSMKDLQDFMKSPKLRGNIGEEVLKDLLEQMIPSENYMLQYAFHSGETVDAALKVEEGLIPVDAKFPLPNFTTLMQAEKDEDRESARKLFTRDVKKHVDDISKKYIIPAEGTVDFALMYIPSEAIYYEVVVNNPELGKYAWSKRVLPVSPNVFYSYLKAILIGLEGKKIESRAKEILATIRSIKEDAHQFSDVMGTLTRHITNAKNTVDEANKKFEKLDNRIKTVESGKNRIETPDQPELIES